MALDPGPAIAHRMPLIYDIYEQISKERHRARSNGIPPYALGKTVDTNRQGTRMQAQDFV